MKLYPIQCGKFKLDGGAMFGVVPKTLWEKTNPADEKNLIELGTRSLLVEDGKKLILIDCGLGNKQDEKFFGHYSLWGDDSLDKNLKKPSALFIDKKGVLYLADKELNQIFKINIKP